MWGYVPVSLARGAPCTVCSCRPLLRAGNWGDGVEFRKQAPGPRPPSWASRGGREYLPQKAEDEAEEGVFPVVGGILGLVDSEGLILAYL